MAGGSDGNEWRPRNANGWEQAQTAHLQHPTALVCLSPSTATCASAQQLWMAGTMNRLSTIPPKTTRVGVLSSTRPNKRVRPGDSKKVQGARGSSGTPTHISTPSACVPVQGQNPGSANQSGNGDARPPLLQFTCEIPRKSTKGKAGKHQYLYLDSFFTKLDETNSAMLPVTFFWLWFSLSVFLPFAFFQPVFNLLLWHL